MGRQMIAVRVPEHLHRKFKALASLKGESMTDLLVEFIREWIEAQEKDVYFTAEEGTENNV